MSSCCNDSSIRIQLLHQASDKTFKWPEEQSFSSQHSFTAATTGGKGQQQGECSITYIWRIYRSAEYYHKCRHNKATEQNGSLKIPRVIPCSMSACSKELQQFLLSLHPTALACRLDECRPSDQRSWPSLHCQEECAANQSPHCLPG